MVGFRQSIILFIHFFKFIDGDKGEIKEAQMGVVSGHILVGIF
jgi:hypothetical protein